MATRSSLGKQLVHPQEPPVFAEPPYTPFAITGEDVVGPTISSRTNRLGEETERTLFMDGWEVTIGGDQFRELQQLAEKIQRTAAYRHSVSTKIILDEAFMWTCLYVQEKISQTLTDFVAQKANEAVADLQILIPVHELLLDSPIQIGSTIVRPLTGVEMDRWVEDLSRAAPDHRTAFINEIEAKRREVQGRAVCEITLRAEPDFAGKVAIERASDTLALLNLFSRAAFEPTVTSFAVPLGMQNVRTERCHVIRNGEYRGENSRIANARFGTFWRITKDDADTFLSVGLRELGELLAKTDRNEYEQKLLESAMLYSTATTSATLSDKLVYVIVALESFMLRNDTEPIQSAISERVAFTIGESAPQRRAIAQEIRAAYALRSKFVHHGEVSTDVATMRTFMRHVHSTLLTLLANRAKFPKRDALFDLIENLKFA